MKFFKPLTSLYNKTPQSEETTQGPLETIGKVTACERALFARKNELFPIPHINPALNKKNYCFIYYIKPIFKQFL